MISTKVLDCLGFKGKSIKGAVAQSLEETFPKFNLPPLHVMKKTLIPLVVEKIEVEKNGYVMRTTR